MTKAADPAERAMYAEDAYASVRFLSLLMFLWGAISLARVPMKPFGPWNLLQAVGGAIAVLYFYATRKRPSTRIAVGLSTVMILYALLLLPWTTMVWADLGRPWEAFTVPQIAMVAVALVTPRYFWLGVGVLALFAGECLFAYVYARHVGLAARTPATEPYFSLFFAILSLGVLMLRAERRQLMLRHIRIQAESEALRLIGPLFTRFRSQLGVYLAALEHQLGLMRGGASAARPLRRMDRAVRRLSTLNETLHDLDDGAATTGAAEPSAAPRGRSTPLVASDAERRLLARDAHTGTTIFVGMIAATTPVILIEHEAVVAAPLFRFALAEAVLIFAMLVYLVATRRRPSERRATGVMLVVYLALLPILIANGKGLLAMNRPYAPFVGQKFLMVSMALVAGSRLGLGIALNLLTWASAIVAFYVLGLGAHRDLVSVSEPWVTTVYMLIGFVVLVMRERRRIASIEVLRAEAEAGAQSRRLALILAFRDQLNSPLQSLLASVVLLDLGSPRGHDDATPMRIAVDGLVSLSRDLNRIEDAIPSGSSGISFDGAKVLARSS